MTSVQTRTKTPVAPAKVSPKPTSTKPPTKTPEPPPQSTTPKATERGRALKYFVDGGEVPHKTTTQIDEDFAAEQARIKARARRPRPEELEAPVRPTKPGEAPKPRAPVKVLGTTDKFGKVMKGPRGGTYVVVNGLRYYGKFKLKK